MFWCHYAIIIIRNAQKYYLLCVVVAGFLSTPSVPVARIRMPYLSIYVYMYSYVSYKCMWEFPKIEDPNIVP